jgi:hypothetical protein
MRRFVLLAVLFISTSLIVGVAGYHYTEGLPWIDALLNASMILGGMGPVNELHNWQSKLFASFYALFSCFVALGLIGIMVAPLMHRVLHRYHSDPDNP